MASPDLDAARRAGEDALAQYDHASANVRIWGLPVEIAEALRSLLAATAPAPSSPLAPDPERRADAMGRLVKSFETAEELRRWTHAEIADLLSEHWMEIDGLSAASDLVAEVLDRLRGLKTCADCNGYGYLDHGRCATCEGTGDVERPSPPAPASEVADVLRRADEVLSWLKFEDGVPVEWPEASVIASCRSRIDRALCASGAGGAR